MNVRDTMTRAVCLVSPDASIREAAQMMADKDIGALPVGENDRLVGMLTDRDIAVRAVAVGCAPDTRVRDVMSKEVLYCFEDEDLEHVARNMGDMKVRRLPVLDRTRRLIGIVSVSDLARDEDCTTTGETVAHISAPGGAHSQASTH